MNDPHVETLHYRLKHSDSVDYDKAPPLEYDCESFSLCLTDDQLVVTMKEHFPTEKAARAVVESFLRAWEIDVALRLVNEGFTFIFDHSNIIDRAPTPEAARIVTLSAPISLSVSASMGVNAHVSRSKYPAPPQDFTITPDVETLVARYEGYRNGKEPLLSMANFCLTLVEERAQDVATSKGKKRKKAADIFQIDIAILKQLGHWCAEKGDAQTARKYSGGFDPLNGKEKRWVEECVKSLIHQVATHAASPAALTQVTMEDLPSLP